MAETCSHIALRRLNGPESQESYQALPEVYLTQDDRKCLVITADYLPHKIVTNDLIQFTGPDSFLWLGRYDNLISSGGIKIVPEEVEAKVMAKTGLECAVVDLPDNELGQKVVFVFEKGKLPIAIQELKTDLDQLLPRHWRPKEILFVDSFPRNKTWKIDRRKLRTSVAQ
jgi:O-succinylbenzoic acid--CoA ligase